jgi:hypothetical protein
LCHGLLLLLVMVGIMVVVVVVVVVLKMVEDPLLGPVQTQAAAQ